MNKITVITAPQFKVPPIEYIADTLPWHKTEKWEQRPVESIKRIIIHHTASEAPLYNQALYHVNTHGWAGLSYHLIISGGRINQVNSLEDITYHAASNNMDSVAICIHGDLSKREITVQERELLYAAILTVKSLCNIEEVIGHNQVNATSCPCTSMDRIRNDLQTIQNQMEYAKSEEFAKATAFTIANQILYMANMLNGKMSDGSEATPGQKTWAKTMLLELSPFLKDRGLL